jgi:hypothetical protein
MVGVGRSLVLRGGVKNFSCNRRDEVVYRRHLFAFKKAFPNFIYCYLDNSKPFSVIPKVEETKCTTIVKEKQPK